MFIVRASVAIAATVIMFIDQYWYLDRHWVGLLNSYWHMLLNVYGVRPVNGHFHWYGHWPFYLNRDVFVYWVGLRHGYLDRYGVRSVYVYGVRPVHRNVHGVSYGLLNWNSDWHWLFNGVRSWYMHGVRPVNGNFYGYTDMFNNWVGLGYVYLNFDGVRHVLLNGVGLRNWHLDGVRDVFLNWVGLRHKYFDGVRPVDGHMDWVGHFLFYWVWCRYVYGNLNVFLNVNGHMFDDLVGLGNGDLDGVGDVLLNRVGHWSVNWYSDWDSLDESYSPSDVGAATKVDAISRTGIRSFIVVVYTAHSVATADVADV